VIKTFLDLPQKLAKVLGNLQKTWTLLCDLWTIFREISSEIFWKWWGEIFRKSSKLLLSVCLYTKENHSSLLIWNNHSCVHLYISLEKSSWTLKEIFHIYMLPMYISYIYQSRFFHKTVVWFVFYYMAVSCKDWKLLYYIHDSSMIGMDALSRFYHKDKLNFALTKWASGFQSFPVCYLTRFISESLTTNFSSKTFIEQPTPILAI